MRKQLIHLMSVDEIWFCGPQGVEPLEPLLPTISDDRKNLRAYLAILMDEMLFEKPIIEPEEEQDFAVWQVLLHIVNHSIDHHAQLLRLPNDLGIKTESLIHLLRLQPLKPMIEIAYLADHLVVIFTPVKWFEIQ